MAVVSCVASRVLLFNRQVSDSLTRVLHSFVCELMVSLATSCLFVLFSHIPHRVHDTKKKIYAEPCDALKSHSCRLGSC